MTAVASRTAQRRDNVLRLADDRMLGYAEYGAPDGTPVFGFHGFPGSRAEFSISDEAAAERGVRVIAPDRPGMGLSSFKKGRRLLDWPQDVLELADALAIERFAVAGVSGGGPYALACAYRIPQRLTGAAVISGGGPLDRPGATEGMMRTNRILFGAQRRFPPAGRAIVWLSGLLMRNGGERGIERMMRFLPPADRAILARKEVRAMFAEDVAEAYRNGARGCALENGIYTRPWGFRIEEITMPVHVWQGGQDRNVPPAHGRSFVKALPNAVEHFYLDEGHLLIVDRIGEIIDAITTR